MFFERLLEGARRAPPRRVAVAAAAGRSVLEALAEAREQGIARPLFFGDEEQLLAEAARAGIAISTEEIAHAPDPHGALLAAVTAVRQGRCGVLLKGTVPTPDFLRAVLDRERGLRGPGLLTHMAAFELDALDRPLFLTDSGLNPAPDLARKEAILREGIRFLHGLGYARPKVAILAASEEPDPHIPASRDAVALVERAAGDAFGAADIAGPYALDLAVSPAAAASKGVVSPVAGRADLLICPDVVAGNLLGKSMLFLAGARAAGLILGAAAPVVMLSRADSPEARLRSLSLAIAWDQASRR